MTWVDLHLHSTASDGTMSPEALPALARQAGLSAIALTDHDTTAGLAACAQACEAINLDFVPGIEISADPGPRVNADGVEQRRGSLHLLGLFVRHDDPQLEQIHHRMKEARDSRNPAMIQKLQAAGVRIEYEEVRQLAAKQGTQIIGRPHIAQLLVQKRYAKSIADAFGKYLKFGRPGFVRRDYLAPEDAIDAIHHAGGLAILAHPVQLMMPDPDQLEHAVSKLKRMGLDGLEVYHPDHSSILMKQYQTLAQKWNLLICGGSDFHGSRKEIALGSQQVPREIYEQLKAACPSSPVGDTRHE